MKNLFYILFLSGILLASCSRKILPPAPTTSTITKDSIIVRETVVYKKDTLQLPGDTIVMMQAVPCPEAKFEQTLVKGKTTLTAKLNKGVLTVNCSTDSINHIVDSLKQIILETEHLRTTEKTITVPYTVTVTKKRVPAWCWYLLSANVLMIAWKFRSSIFKIFKQ